MAFFLGCSTLGLRFRAPRRRVISLRMAVGSSLRRFRLLAAILSGGGFIFARMYPRGRLSGPAGFSAGGVSFRPFDGLLIRGGSLTALITPWMRCSQPVSAVGIT